MHRESRSEQNQYTRSGTCVAFTFLTSGTITSTQTCEYYVSDSVTGLSVHMACRYNVLSNEHAPVRPPIKAIIGTPLYTYV